MRWLLAPLVMVAACRIPDDHFIGLSDDAGGGDAMGDAAPQTSLRKAWLLDQNNKLYVVRKDVDGALMLTANVTTTSNPQSAVVNKQGTHLFVANVNAATGNGISDFLINPDGTLANPTFRGLTAGGVDCSPAYMAVHPAGRFLAVGCTNARIAIVSLDPDGAIMAGGIVTHTSVGVAPANLVFTLDGACLFAVDRQAGNMTLHRLAFDPSSGNSALIATTPSAANKAIAVHPNGEFLYVAGDTSVQMQRIMPGCALSLLDTDPINGTAAGNTSIVIAPDGRRLFVSASGIYTYEVAPDGMMSPLPNNPTLTNIMVEASTMDPALPNILYVTSRADGTYPLAISSNGGLTSGAATRPTGSGTNFVGFVMAP